MFSLFSVLFLFCTFSANELKQYLLNAESEAMRYLIIVSVRFVNAPSILLLVFENLMLNKLPQMLKYILKTVLIN